ncbi:hypothetical protein NL676_036688 [Syzygium grande]|nr:hypothetical protein NL676_036688 [Syzygium grande]
MIWIWPGDDASDAILPSLLPPSGFVVHAEIVMELPVEHGLLLDNLLDLAHAPFTHTSTFAKGWSVPSLVKFLTPASGLQGYWDPYPIDMEFRPPFMVLLTIGISKPGKLEGQSTPQCATHLHQLHVCLPSTTNKTRLLYRMSLDFAPLLKQVPFVQYLWRHFAEQSRTAEGAEAELGLDGPVAGTAPHAVGLRLHPRWRRRGWEGRGGRREEEAAAAAVHEGGTLPSQRQMGTKKSFSTLSYSTRSALDPHATHRPAPDFSTRLACCSSPPTKKKNILFYPRKNRRIPSGILR